MSLWSAYKGLTSRTRLAVGLGIIAWATAGLYLSDRAEEKFGYTPTEQDKAQLDKYKPKIHFVERDEVSASSTSASAGSDPGRR